MVAHPVLSHRAAPTVPMSQLCPRLDPHGLNTKAPVAPSRSQLKAQVTTGEQTLLLCQDLDCFLRRGECGMSPLINAEDDEIEKCFYRWKARTMPAVAQVAFRAALGVWFQRWSLRRALPNGRPTNPSFLAFAVANSPSLTIIMACINSINCSTGISPQLAIECPLQSLWNGCWYLQE